MGLFDTINVKKETPIICPKCKAELVSFQTKDLNRLLDVYEENTNKRLWFPLRKMTVKEVAAHKTEFGITVFMPYTSDIDKPRYTPHPTYTSVYAYDLCTSCKNMVGQIFRFDTNGTLKRYKKPILEKKEPDHGKRKSTNKRRKAE